MADKFYDNSGLTCVFTLNKGEVYGNAQLFDANKQEIAYSIDLGKPLVNRLLFANGGNEYLGNSILPHETSNIKNENIYNMVQASKEDGFSIVTDKRSADDRNDGHCNVELADGRKFDKVPMKIIHNSM